MASRVGTDAYVHLLLSCQAYAGDEAGTQVAMWRLIGGRLRLGSNTSAV